MVLNNLRIVVVLSLILIVHSRIRFKTKTCKQKREVTVVYDAPSKDQRKQELSFFMVKVEYQRFIKTLRKYENEFCLKLSCVDVKFTSNRKWDKFMDFVKINDVQSKYIGDNYSDEFKDILQTFAIEDEGKKRRTLVFFSNRLLKQDIVDILYRIQTERNVIVILVSMFADIFTLKQFPRHLKFIAFYQVHKQLVDVIKNPNFNRFDFDKNLPSFKDRSCLENVNIILLISKHDSVMMLFTTMIINAISNYIRETLPNIQALVDTTTQDKRDNVDALSFITIYKLDFQNTTFSQINETGVLRGSRKNIFIEVDDQNVYARDDYSFNYKDNYQYKNNLGIFNMIKLLTDQSVFELYIIGFNQVFTFQRIVLDDLALLMISPQSRLLPPHVQSFHRMDTRNADVEHYMRSIVDVLSEEGCK